MKLIDNIPRIWKQAYLIICLWYALNYTISTIVEWSLFKRYTLSVLWNGLYLFEAVCIFVALTFLWADWLFRFKMVFQVAGHTLGLLAYFMLMGSLSYYFEDYLDGFVYLDDWKEYMISLLSWDAMRFYDQYIITVGVYYVIRYFQNMRKKEKEKSQLALKNKEMQISLLKSQINPHFLFNTLNSISTLIGTSKEKARKVITQLSDVFRYALDSHEDHFVKVVHELDFIDNYILIQQVRFGDRLKYVKNIEPTCLSVDIPPMILQPLVENAVKYGIGPKDEGGTITLTIQRRGRSIYFEIKDDGLGVNAKKVLDGTSNGVGVKNTDKRLTGLYGKSAKLRIHADENGYTVGFSIPTRDFYNLEDQETKEGSLKELVEN